MHCLRAIRRQCSSGLQAIADVAAAIQAGYYTIGIGAGVETMSINPMAWEGGVNPKIETCPAAGNCLLPMGTRLGLMLADGPAQPITMWRSIAQLKTGWVSAMGMHDECKLLVCCRCDIRECGSQVRRVA
jgi:acetyl-CoA acetyltransferase